jgi:DNA-binding GntR family transcriptional regulator
MATGTDSHKAYTKIKERIITTQMPPGSVIHESELMKQLKLGRTPIREALKQLQAEKLVVVAPRRGMFVSDIAITDLQNIHEVRLELESLCARLAVERATPVQLEEIDGLVTRLLADESRYDQNQLMAMDCRLHYLIAQAAGNELLFAEFEMLYNLSLRIWHLYLDRLQPADLDIQAFAEILSAIKTHDAGRADRAMRRHITHFQDSIKQHL